jgi:gamma-glutamyltranspeptidase / glutathione hydrolase
MRRFLFPLPLLLALALLLQACAPHLPPLPGLQNVPPPSAGNQPGRAVAVTAHPLATDAAMAMLRQGGSAVDAAIAAQMVLGLVEPQSSGIGGGALAMHWEAATRRLTSVDGLAAAPAAATSALTIDRDGRAIPAEQVRRGGRSVGVPGALPLFELLHQRDGKLPWAALFEPAIRHAGQGFAMPPYLHSLLTTPDAARDHPEFASRYFDREGRVLPPGSTITDPGYARTVRSLATLGARGWLLAGAARDIVQAAQRGDHPGLIAESDLLAYRAEPREPLCAPRLAARVCVMGPSSFGGIAVLQMLGTLAAAPPPLRWDFGDAAFVHRFAESGRLAYADRLQHAGDPGFVVVPAGQLVSQAYVERRARAIDPARAASQVRPGELSPTPTSRSDPHRFEQAAEHADATSQIVVVDTDGNVLALTTTINLNFGSRLVAGGLADGVVLNNAMTNFSALPTAGLSAPNRMQPGKRPVSSMTPTIVFDERGEPLLAGGSAGGAQIVDYVAQALIEMLANSRSPAEALATGHVAAGPAGVQLERGRPAAALAPQLQAMGHRVSVADLRSGLGFARRGASGWTGAADPRRDGVALTLP